jgi:hypothetical protein
MDWWRDAAMMGIQPSELEDITPAEFNLFREGYKKRQENQWEHTRFIVWGVIASQSSNPPKVEEIVPLPIDEIRKERLAKADHSRKMSRKEQKRLEDYLNKMNQ